MFTGIEDGVGEKVLRVADLTKTPKPSNFVHSVELIMCRLILLHTIFWAAFAVYYFKSKTTEKPRAVAFLWFVYCFAKYACTGYFSCIGLRDLRRNVQRPIGWWRHNAKAQLEQYQDNICMNTSTSLCGFDEIIHVLVIPIYDEDVNILRRTLNGIAAQSVDNITVVLAMEARVADVQERTGLLMAEYQEVFSNLHITLHRLSPGEVGGKSSNVNWATRCVKKKLVDQDGMDSSRIVVTVMDSDTVLHPAFLPALSHAYCMSNDRATQIWQGSIHFYPNMDSDVPGLCAVRYTTVALGHLGQLRNPIHCSLPFSCYSLSLDLIVDANYCNPAKISEDWNMFLRCFFATQGNARTIPLLLPVGCDCVVDDTEYHTVMACHKQAIRWQWGASDLAFFVANAHKAFFTNPVATIHLLFSIVEHHLLYPLMWLMNSAWIWLLVGFRGESLAIWALFYVCTFLSTVGLDLKYRQLLDPVKRIGVRRILWFLLFPVADILFHVVPTAIAHTKLFIAPTKFDYVVAPKSKIK